MSQFATPRPLREGFTPAKWGDVWCAGLLLALAAAFFRQGLFPNPPVVFAHYTQSDLTCQFYPWRDYAFTVLGKGKLPLWNPYLFCGYPFAASWQSAVFYPLNLAFLFFPIYLSLNYSFTLHIFLSGLFSYLFMRTISGSRFAALVAAVSFMFSSTLILRIFAGHLSIICAVPWFPAELLAVEAWLRNRRWRYAILGGIACGLQILAGHPQIAYYSLIGVILYALFRVLFSQPQGKVRRPLRTFVFVACVIILGACLAAVQLLPSIEFVRYSARGQEGVDAQAGVVSFPPENTLTFLMPDAFGDFVKVFCWGRCYLWGEAVYIGILPLICAFLALFYKRDEYVYILWSLVVISFIIALGSHTPLFDIIYRCLPGFSLLKGPTKILFLTVFSLCCLAGYGARGVLEGVSGRGRRVAAVWVIVIVLLFFASLIYALDLKGDQRHSVVWRALVSYRKNADASYWPVLDSPLFLREAYELFRGGAVRLCLLLGLSALVLLYSSRRGARIRCAQFLVLGVIIADLWSYDVRFLTTVPLAACRWPRDIVRFFSGDKTVYRVMRDIRVAVPRVNQGMSEGIFSYEGYETDSVGLFGDFSAFSGLRSEQGVEIMARPGSSKLASMVNIKYLMVPPAIRPMNPEYLFRWDRGSVRIFENSRVLPRAFVVHRALVTGDPEIARRLLLWRGFDPASLVILAEDPRITLSGVAGSSPAKIEEYAPDTVTIRCRLSEPGVLFLSDVYYPGWEVMVDGRPDRILRANYAFRAVALDKGEHMVCFRYRPSSFRRGAWVSLVTVAACAVWGLARWRRAKKCA
jgi:hypothetical protein